MILKIVLKKKTNTLLGPYNLSNRSLHAPNLTRNPKTLLNPKSYLAVITAFQIVLGFEAAGIKLRVPGFGCQISGNKLRVSSFGFRDGKETMLQRSSSDKSKGPDFLFSSSMTCSYHASVMVQLRGVGE